jgi:hypothetical protein
MDYLVPNIILEEQNIEHGSFFYIVSILGNALALFFFFCPAIGIIKLAQGKIKHETIPYFALIANTLNCILWFVFGLKQPKDSLWIWPSNLLGAFVSLIYLIIYWYYFVEKNMSQYSLYSISTIVGVLSIASGFYYLDPWEAGAGTGWAAVVFNIIMYAAPAQKIVKILLLLFRSNYSKQVITILFLF